MRFAYVVRPKADRDIDEIADYIAENVSLNLGIRFLAEVYETFALMATNLRWAGGARLAIRS